MEENTRKHKNHIGAILGVILLIIAAVAAVLILPGLFGEDTEEATDEAVPEENNIDFEIQGEKYYYSLLTDPTEQQAYREIVQGIDEEQDEIRLELTDSDRVNTLFQMVVRDYPEYFWCDGSSTTTAYTGSENYAILEPVYQYPPDQRSEMQQQIDEVVSQCLAGVSAESGEYERIQYVYEWIVNTVDYDWDAPDNQNIYSVFVGKRSVCAGYSKAAQYLLEKLGVFCTYVTGDADGSARHAWNLVRIGEDYYDVDVTWGDPVFQTVEEGETQNHISYDYLCCDDAQLFITHTPDPDYPLPSCTHMDYNYYVLNGMYYTAFDPQEIQQKMNDVINEKGNPSVFKFSSRELYEEAHDAILGDLANNSLQNLMQIYGLQSTQYQYLDEPNLNKITIYWQYD